MSEWFYNVVGAVVASVVFEVLRPFIPVLYGRLQRAAPGEPEPEAPPSIAVPPIAAPRASVPRQTAPAASRDGLFESRQRRFGEFVLGVVFYFLHIVLVYMAICFPVQFLVSPERPYLELSEARLIGSSLPALRLGSELMSLNYLKVTLGATVLLFMVARVVSWPVWQIGAYFGHESVEFRRTAQIGVFFLLCFVLSAHVIFLFSGVSYGSAWGIVGGVFVALVILSHLRNKKRAA